MGEKIPTIIMGCMEKERSKMRNIKTERPNGTIRIQTINEEPSKTDGSYKRRS